MSDNHGACILVVDDHRDNRDVLARRLARQGYRCVTASSGEQALERVGDCDAVLLDINMPGMSGLDCLRRLREQHNLDALPVIMVTARDESEDVIECLAAGASDYVSKPIDFPVLLARLRTWLRLKELRDTREHFLRIASHDLRNPLTRILTTTDLVRELVPPGQVMPAQIHELLGGVGDAAQRMTRIIEDFVDLQVLQDGGMSLDLAPVEVGDLLEPALARQASWAQGKDIRLFVEQSCDATILADADRIEQVLDNLVGNAVKYSRGGTEVGIRCETLDDVVLIEVRDQGPGLTDADLERVFERYARLSARPTAGEVSSGLGLSIAREIVEQHGGELGVRNNDPGPGATFWVRLPLEH